MRVKLSYTVDGEDVLAETAKLINLSAADLQQAIRLFTDVQIELAGGDEDSSGPVNISKSLEMIEEFRKALLTVDIRLSEAVDIVRGYREYQQSQESLGATGTLSSGGAGEFDTDLESDIFGSD